jgi:hypothetical protein
VSNPPICIQTSTTDFTSYAPRANTLLMKLMVSERGIATELDTEVVAVDASRYREAGGKTTSLLPQYAIDPTDYRCLGDFEEGAEIFYRSENPADYLDGTNARAQRYSRIWWRATVIGAAIEVEEADLLH